MTKEQIIGTKEQRKMRIGGSEYGTIIHLNPYKTRFQLCLEKAGVIADTFEGNEATRRGEALENDVIAMFEDRTGLNVTDEQKEFSLKVVGSMEMVAHVDGITSDNCVFEAKTTDIKSKTWSEGIPYMYKAQLSFNCMLAKKEKAYIAVGHCKGNEIVNFEYFEYLPEHDKDTIISVCREFTKQILECREKYGIVNNGKIIKSDFKDNYIVELESINEEIAKIKAQAKVYEDRKKYIEDMIKKEIGQNNGFETDLFKVTLGQRITNPATDYRISRSGIKIEYLK